MPSKRKRADDRPTIHPRNKYSEKPPDFAALASLYPTFKPYVFYSSNGRPRIDWTDYNATRELTRVLLLHDHGLNWWIPDGQLCPTVPNRSNYIHWIQDLLSSEIISKDEADAGVVKGFDIGTGANCIYPLLGASLMGWKFVGSDVTAVALDWAEQNVKSNPHVSDLIEIRKVDSDPGVSDEKEVEDGQNKDDKSSEDLCHLKVGKTGLVPSCPTVLDSMNKKSYDGPPILVGVVKESERFDFCMCNPPFFETMDEAGLNPKTACGGTLEEMVCPGGEMAFISRIIADSTTLKNSFRWYTSMVGRKANLKILISKLRDSRVSIVKQTEFVQGQTCRWGLAWSFVSPCRKSVPMHVTEKNKLSFVLEGLQRQHTVVHVLQALETFFCSGGASCKLDMTAFKIDVIASKETCEAILTAEAPHICGSGVCQSGGLSSLPDNLNLPDLQFTVSVFQQTPGTLLVRGLLCHRESPSSGKFFLIFRKVEEVLKEKFCRAKT